MPFLGNCGRPALPFDPSRPAASSVVAIFLLPILFSIWCIYKRYNNKGHAKNVEGPKVAVFI